MQKLSHEVAQLELAIEEIEAREKAAALAAPAEPADAGEAAAESGETASPDEKRKPARPPITGTPAARDGGACAGGRLPRLRGPRSR
jgi:hypothetical protein